VRPDLAYSLATNKLNVNFEKESSSKEDKKYMFFKTALSIESQLKNGILDTAFKKRLPSRVAVCIRINHRVSYNKANIANIDMQFH
jgi:hypothetical protein